MTRDKSLWVIWKEPLSQNKFKIGILSIKNNLFYFIYYKNGLEKAQQYGFKKIFSFSDIDKTYCSDMLFNFFNSRIPSENKQGIEKILKAYGMKSYDKIQLLVKTKGILITDNYEIAPKYF